MSGLTLPAVATGVAVVLLYTNLPVLVAQRGMAPRAVAVLVPLLLLVAAAHQILVRRRGILVDRTLCAMLAFLAVLLMSMFAAESYGVAVGRIGAFLGEGLLVYFLVRNAVRSLPELRVAVVAVLASAGFLAGLTVLQAVTGHYEQDFLGLASRSLDHLEGLPASHRDGLGLEDRAGGPVDEPNRFAQILLMAVPLGFVLALNARRRRHAVAAAAAVALLLGGVLLTYSRGAFLTLVVLLLLTAPLGLMRPARLIGALCVGLVVTSLVPGYAARVASIAGVADLFGKGRVEADGPTRGRTTEMLASLAAYTDHPVLGVGPGQYMPYHSVRYQALPEISIRELPTPRRAHNLYLEIGAETGTVGLVIFLAIPLLLLRDLEGLRRQLSPRRPELARLAAGFTLVLLSYLGTGVFLHLAFERYYWFVVALAAAAAGILDRVDVGDVGHGDAARVAGRPTARTVRVGEVTW